MIEVAIGNAINYSAPHAAVGLVADFVALLAQRSNWSRLGDRFSGEYLRLRPEDLIGAAALVAVFVGGYWLLRYLGEAQDDADRKACPKRLFDALARSHGLTRAERRAVRDAAEEAGLPRAADAFLRPDLAERLDPDLANRLFGVGTDQSAAQRA